MLDVHDFEYHLSLLQAVKQSYNTTVISEVPQVTYNHIKERLFLNDYVLNIFRRQIPDMSPFTRQTTYQEGQCNRKGVHQCI